jgi:outer membrane protein assembly factor BamB
MKNLLSRSVVLMLAGALFCLPSGNGQEAGNWPVSGNDAAHNNWQKAEAKLSTDTVGQFKFLWKMKLGKGEKETPSFTEPLLATRLVTAKGFKDLVLWADTSTIYAVDSELGRMVWEKHLDVPSSGAPCGAGNLELLVEPPRVINFGAHRAPGAHRPPPEQPVPAGSRRVGAAAGGGYFGLKGVYVLTADGYVHEQVLTTGVDFAPAVKFLPGPAGIANGLNIDSDVLYTATRRGCGSAENAVWALDMSSADYPVGSYKMGAVAPLAAISPTLANGAVYLTTGSGAEGDHPHSIVALAAKSLDVKDWYTPADNGALDNIAPAAFTYKEKHLIAGPGSNGSLVLLDSDSLGGSDHHTPLSQTASVSKMKSEGWGGIATWEDKTGTPWVLASVSGSLAKDAGFQTSNGPAAHGAVVAFKVEDKDGKTQLTPAWSSRDLVNPAPPVVANGLVIVLSQGDAKVHAKLYVLDAATGKELYTSGDEIPTYAHLSGVAVGDSHAFFTTHDGTLYSFGIGLEH